MLDTEPRALHDQCMAPNDELCTAADLAEIYNTSAATVRRWARDGRIPVVTLPSGRRRFRRSDVEALLAGDAGTAA